MQSSTTMLSEQDLIARLADTLGVEPAALSRTTTANDLEAWDSMGTMSILLWLSDDFDIKLAPNETAQLQSVEGILKLVSDAGKLS